MSATTAAALRPTGDPVTPVIIKSGGGDEGPQDPQVVDIESATIPFAETVAGPTWVSSQSTSPGRIKEVKIHDGATTTHHVLTPADTLASVIINFGSAQLIAMESGIAADNNVLLLLTSPEVPFNVTEISEGRAWNKSSGTFPEEMTGVLLMVGGQQQLRYTCENPGVQVKITFEND
jgi:hypothetical protein